MAFMHLGHEVKPFKYVILMPYIIFMFYGIFIILTEGTYAGGKERVTRVDPILVEQQVKLRASHGHGAAHEASAGHQEAPKGGAHH